MESKTHKANPSFNVGRLQQVIERLRWGRLPQNEEPRHHQHQNQIDWEKKGINGDNCADALPIFTYSTFGGKNKNKYNSFRL